MPNETAIHLHRNDAIEIRTLLVTLADWTEDHAQYCETSAEEADYAEQENLCDLHIAALTEKLAYP